MTQKFFICKKWYKEHSQLTCKRQEHNLKKISFIGCNFPDFTPLNKNNLIFDEDNTLANIQNMQFRPRKHQQLYFWWLHLALKRTWKNWVEGENERLLRLFPTLNYCSRDFLPIFKTHFSMFLSYNPQGYHKMDCITVRRK